MQAGQDTCGTKSYVANGNEIIIKTKYKSHYVKTRIKLSIEKEFCFGIIGDEGFALKLSLHQLKKVINLFVIALYFWSN